MRRHPGADTAAANIGGMLSEATATLRDAGSESPRLDAELLLGHVLGMARAGLLAHPELVLSPSAKEGFEAALARRAAGEPVAYIRGLKEFYGLAFAVDRRALIPRPETELLVGLAIERLRDVLTTRPRPPGAPPLRLWDVGTGSGAIAISVAVECRRRGYADDVRLLATDISADALALATENAVGHGVADIIDFVVGDLLERPAVAAVDVICANLPYLPTAVIAQLPVAASFEPVAALDGGTDGLELVRRLLSQLPGRLAADGIALLEIGADQAARVRDAVDRALPGWSVTVHPDLGGQPRAAEIGPTRGGPS